MIHTLIKPVFTCINSRTVARTLNGLTKCLQYGRPLLIIKQIGPSRACCRSLRVNKDWQIHAVIPAERDDHTCLLDCLHFI